MIIQIKNRYDDSIIFEGEFNCLMSAVEKAIKKNISLHSADLRSANLHSADLRSANLHSADLRSADLRYADLRSAKGINKYTTTDLYMLYDQVGKIRSYKLVTGEFVGPYNGGIKYEIGNNYSVKDANTDESVECANGISLATLPWVMASWKQGYRILIAEHTAKDIAAIPIGSDGKYRVHKCKIVGEKSLKELGLIGGENENQS